MRRALVILVLLAPLVRAQNAPVTLSLTPREPWVIFNPSWTLDCAAHCSSTARSIRAHQRT
jgi:hypothetical protein